MTQQNNKLKVGLLGVYTAPGDINQQVDVQNIYGTAVKEIDELSKKYDFDFLSYKDQLVTAEDGDKARRFADDNKIDFLIIFNTGIASGYIIPYLAKTNARIGLWAIPEPTKSGVITTLSFVGLNMNASIIKYYLKNFDIKFKWFYGHPGNDLFDERIGITIKALKAIKKFANSRVGLIGGIAPGWDDQYFDERIYEKIWGLKIYRRIDISDVINIAGSFKNDDIKKENEIVRSEAENVNVGEEEISKSNRVFLALKDIAKQEKYDAMAISCWPKFQQYYNLAVCHTIARLNESGLTVADEGDLPGAVSMLLLNYLRNDTLSTLLDFFDFDEEDQRLYFWHCGPTAKWWANKNGISLEKHPSLKGNPGVLSRMSFKETETTIMRIIGEGDEAFVFNTNSIDDAKPKFEGASGWFGNIKIGEQKVSVRDIINTILVAGHPHHYPIAPGNLYKELMEIFGWLGIRQKPLVKYRSYIQLD